jgi:hypothetical protein
MFNQSLDQQLIRGQPSRGPLPGSRELPSRPTGRRVPTTNSLANRYSSFETPARAGDFTARAARAGDSTARAGDSTARAGDFTTQLDVLPFNSTHDLGGMRYATMQ